MTARVYSFDASEEETLKKLLAYDPYLDTSLIPNIPKDWSDKKYMAAHPELKDEIERKKKEAEDAAAKLRSDPEANIIFARQDYKIKDGRAVGLDEGKSYLYISASDEFLSGAEAKLKKNLKSILRASPDEERKVIAYVEEEREKSEEGLGLIFG